MTTRARRSVADLNEAEVLFGSETFASFRSERRCGDGFDEELGDFGCGLAIDGAIDANDPAECGDGIAGESLLIGLEDGGSRCGAAGVGVLDDDDGGLVKFLREFPACVEIDEIVEAEFLSLELSCTGDAQAGAVGVERGALVGVLAITQRLGQRHVDAERSSEKQLASAMRAGASAWDRRRSRQSDRGCWR